MVGYEYLNGQRKQTVVGCRRGRSVEDHDHPP